MPRDKFSINDPRHGIEGKAAIAALTRDGLLRLLYQQPSEAELSASSWSETSTKVETMTSSKEAFTHASFCGESMMPCAALSNVH